MGAQAAAIVYDAPRIRFLINGRRAAERLLPDLRRVIAFDFGSPLHGNDGTFTLLDFTDAFWIVPDDVGLPTHAAWAAHLEHNRGYFKASIFWPPKRWCAGGIFGLLQSPGPRVVPAEPLPAADLPWQLAGPLNPGVFPPQTL